MSEMNHRAEQPEAQEFVYSGTELELFAAAQNWKGYWRREIDPFLGQQVLEPGAGIGATARTLNHRSYGGWLGLEPDATMCRVVEAAIAGGRLSANHAIVCGTSHDLKEQDRFDTVLYIDVLEHIEDDGAELQRVAQHLMPGGHIIIVSPAHNFLYTPFDRKIGHFRRYDRAMLKAILPRGLTIERMRYLDSVGLLASLANKVILKSDTPKASQILFWDSVLVRASLWVDRLTFHRLGKSILCVMKKPF